MQYVPYGDKLTPALPLIFFVLGKVTEILRLRPGSSDPVELPPAGGKGE